MSGPVIRPIEARDDHAVAGIIRIVMPEHGASGPGYAIQDPEVDGMHAAYSRPRHGYWVVERDGVVLGGGGFAPLTGGAEGTCELRKMYFLPELRGLGLGEQVVATILAGAKEAGFERCYLETLTSMKAAQRLYEKKGFQRLDGPRGDTGHFGCNTFYERAL